MRVRVDDACDNRAGTQGLARRARQVRVVTGHSVGARRPAADRGAGTTGTRSAVIAVDLSDITKAYAKAMPNLAAVRAWAMGEISKGNGLATAVVVDPEQERRAVPQPVMFEVSSTTEEDFQSQPAIWLVRLRRICAGTKAGTFAIDREGDDGRILRLLLAEKRHFVVRPHVHESSRHVVFDENARARVRDLWEGARLCGESEATRLLDDGQRGAYRARYGSRPVWLPGHEQQLWMCDL
jgi:hypothetical protein